MPIESRREQDFFRDMQKVAAYLRIGKTKVAGSR